MEVIKQLVKSDLGITFVYQAAVKKELIQGELKQLQIKNLDSYHEFNFVFPKGSQHTSDFLEWFHQFKNHYT